MENTKDVLQPMIIPVVTHTVVTKPLPPIVKVVHCDCVVYPSLDCCQDKEDDISKVAKKALKKLDEDSGEKKEETIAELANRALENLGGEKRASKDDSLKDLTDKALKKVVKNSKSKKSSKDGDSDGDSI